jgi:CheY-like chemotaxis protein
MLTDPLPRATKGAVLVVEDDHDIRVTLRAVIEGEGYPVYTASNGQEAIALLESLAEKPRLIVLDLMMPVMDGWQFARLLKSNATLAALPVAVQSAFGSAVSPPSGAVAILKKPIDIQQLIGLIDQHCGPG